MNGAFHDVELDERLKAEVERKSGVISGILKRGRDVEIRRSRDGISITEVIKKVAAR